MLQLGQVTRVYKNETQGAQLCSIKASLSNREYQDVLLITPKWVNYLPEKDDIVLFAEINNNVIVCFGTNETADLSLLEGEVVMHKSTVVWDTVTTRLSIKLTTNNELVMSRFDTSGVVQQSIKFKSNGDIDITAVWDVNIL